MVESLAPMVKEWVMNQDDFDRFLAWLRPDRGEADKRYIEIHRWLIRIFRVRGCPEADAEELADDTITRVVRKMPEIADTYIGDPMPYFRKVAHYVFLEYIREPVLLPLPLPDPWEVKELLHACLDNCMKELPPEDQRVALSYYTDDGRAKIERRQKLAEELGGSNALRIRMHRIRTTLHACISECLEQAAQ
jgi:DNA-directed RNA polymerase specialized sigma24 family protein